MTDNLDSVSLSTPRLNLREFHEADWPAVLNYQSKPAYLRYYPWQSRSQEDVQRFLQLFLNWRLERPRSKFQFAVILAETQALIGICGIRKKSAQDLEAEIGYELDPAYWGRGYATEAAQAVLAFGFEILKVHRIWAFCLAENSASSRLLEKLGMRQEGRLRENRWMKERWWDTLIYAILEHEWHPS